MPLGQYHPVGPGSGSVSSGGGSSGITINTTTITGGTDTAILFDKAGVVSEDSGLEFDYVGRNLKAPAFNSILVANGGDPHTTFVGVDNTPVVSANTFNVLIGRFVAGFSAGVTGALNVGIGNTALSHLTGGGSNMAVGSNALGALKTGDNNVAVGTQALGTLDGDSNNVALGANALTLLSSGHSNVGIGTNAAQAEATSSFVTAIGVSALFACTGAQNMAIGPSAGVALVSGTGNTIIGSFIPGSSITSGSNNTLIGNWTGPAGALNSVIALSDGAGNLKADFNNTIASQWTFTGTLNLTAAASAATVAANFTADHRIAVTFNGVTYNLPCSTTAW